MPLTNINNEINLEIFDNDLEKNFIYNKNKNIEKLHFSYNNINEYQLKINKFDPQKNTIENKWEKRLLYRINSFTN